VEILVSVNSSNRDVMHFPTSEILHVPHDVWGVFVSNMMSLPFLFPFLVAYDLVIACQIKIKKIKKIHCNLFNESVKNLK